MDCEVFAGKMSVKARSILRAMSEAAASKGVKVHQSQEYTGRYPLYMTWGLGHPVRREWTTRHVKDGGRVIAWDLGYWDRRHKYRLTIDADHPWRLVRDMPDTRSSGIALRNEYDPKGHIVIIGMGPKSIQVYDGAAGWEQQAIQSAAAAYPGRKIVVRPKYQSKPIEDVIRGASLVVCRHSNVAIDACIAGIPVVCDDGIAKALYGSDISRPVMPTESERRQFIANVGWWQWSPDEAGNAWEFISRTL